MALEYPRRVILVTTLQYLPAVTVRVGILREEEPERRPCLGGRKALEKARLALVSCFE
jgi:hypothetical protein